MKGKGLENWVSRILPLEISFDGLTQDDVDANLIEHRPIPLLFGRISAATVLRDLEQWGIAERLAQRGYDALQVELPQLPVGQEALLLYARHPDSPQRQKLMELKAFWGRLPLAEDTTCRALIWDWLELCDPMAEFTPERRPLPGQTAPGLAMFHDLVRLMRHYVGLTEAEALVTIPQYFHNAVLYQKEPGLRYRFLDPLRQGQLLAQIRDLLTPPGSLFEASWAFAENRVEVQLPGQSDWQGYPWTPSELVLALRPEVEAVFARQEAEVAHGLACQFRQRATPHPDLEGSFHLSGRMDPESLIGEGDPT